MQSFYILFSARDPTRKVGHWNQLKKTDDIRMHKIHLTWFGCCRALCQTRPSWGGVGAGGLVSWAAKPWSFPPLQRPYVYFSGVIPFNANMPLCYRCYTMLQLYSSLHSLPRVENVHVSNPLVAIVTTMHHQPWINHSLSDLVKVS